MKVTVDPERCQGHAMCILSSPDIFTLSDEDGHAFVTNEDVPDGFEDNIFQAQRSCPEQAIIIIEEPAS